MPPRQKPGRRCLCLVIFVPIRRTAPSITILRQDLIRPCGFSDVPAGAWFEAPINWAVEEGITNGIGNNLFDVLGVCNRVQVVTFLHRLMSK